MAKVIGHIRQIDSLGRVVIPVEYRKIMKLNPGDEIEFIFINDKLELKVYKEDK